MTQLDIDLNYIKSIASLHSQDFLIKDEPSAIQLALEEAIRNKTGKSIDITSLIAPSIKQRAEDLKNLSNLIEESKTTSSSDNELELDLLKEDLMCIICKGMEVGARNQLLECAGCHSLYHQECHRPVVTMQEADNNWLCQNCKDLRRIEKVVPVTTIATPTVPKVVTSVQSTTIELPSFKSSVIKSGKRPSSPAKGNSTSKQQSSSASVSGVSRTSTTPNINIISAEKKIQIMKKKAAAKQHEKRKLPR